MVPPHSFNHALSTLRAERIPRLHLTVCNARAQVVRKITRVLPLVGVVITTLLCASPVGQVSGVLKCARPPYHIP